MKTYTIIGGVNGVGKSNMCGVMQGMDENLGVVIDTDTIIAKFDGDKLKSGKEAVRRINDCLEKGESFTQETTLSGQKTLKTIRAAHDKGYLIVLHYIAVSSAEESISRIKYRVSKGGHDIPEADVKRRFEKRFDDVLRVLPHCDFAFFWDNQKVFNQVACYANCEFAIIKKDENPPDWILSLKEMWEKQK